MEKTPDKKADYGFAARDALAQGLPITQNYSQATNPIGEKATYGFAANAMARNGIPVPGTYEEYTGRPVQAPAVINTAPLREKISKNTDFINKAQSAFYPTPTGASIPTPALTPNSGVQTTGTQTAQTSTPAQTPSSGTQATPPQPIQNTFKDNPALSSAVDQLNATISTFKGEMTPEQQALYNSIKANSERYASSIAEAQSAKESGDVKKFNEKANEAKVASDMRTSEINQLFSDMRGLREKYIESLSPSKAETDIETQLADLRASAELGAEAQYGLGRPLSISTGRAEKVLNQGAIQEKNLLARLGIEVKKREAKSEGLKAGLGFLQDDIQLQMKVQERLDKQQEQILSRADKLNDNQRQAMATLADKFKDIDLSAAPETVIRGIQQFALSQGVDAELAMAIVKGAHDQQIYDNIISGTKASATSGETFGLDPSDPIFGAITGLGSVKAQDAALKRYAGFKKSGNEDAANKYLDSVAMSTLSQGQKEDFGVYSDGQTIIDNVLGDMEKFKSTNLNPYKTAVEKLKPLAGLQKDQTWVDITSKIEQAQARIRRGFFGTALTGTEKASADKFLIDFAADDIATAETKLKNMRELATQIKRRLLDQASGKFSMDGSTESKGDGESEVDISDLDFTI